MPAGSHHPLKSGYPWWAIRSGLIRDYPRVDADVRCEVAVVGAGITGALIADELVAHGHDVVVVDQREVGWGSTAASTALLQYEIDTHLLDLRRHVGRAAADRAYLACAEAVRSLEALAASLPPCDFRPQASLYVASRRADVETLVAECRARAAIGLPVQWLDAAEIAQDGIRAHGAIRSDLGAGIDPYRLAHHLLARVVARGGRVFDRSRVETVEPGKRDVVCRVEGRYRLRCRHLIVAAGYAAQAWLPHPVAANRSSYAFVTDVLDDATLGSLRSTMLWETARPYRYLRSTGDGRLVIGGEDDAVDIPARRDRRVHLKAAALARRVARLVPRLQVQPTFAWAGTFAETDDGLPWFGAHPSLGSRVLFAMAYGGNGITYSAIGASLLLMALRRRPHPLAGLFSFARS